MLLPILFAMYVSDIIVNFLSLDAHVAGIYVGVFTARRSYASGVLGVVILSVRLSVTRVLCD